MSSSLVGGVGSLLGKDVAANRVRTSRRFGAREAVSVLPSHFSPTGATGQQRESTRYRKVTVTAKASNNRSRVAAAGAASTSTDSFGGDLPPEKVKSMQRKTLGMMFASYTSIYFVRKPFSVVKAPMQDALNLSTASIAGIDSAFLGLYAIGQLTLPALGDKLGARKMLVVGYLLSAAACFGFGHTSYPILLVRVESTGEREGNRSRFVQMRVTLTFFPAEVRSG